MKLSAAILFTLIIMASGIAADDLYEVKIKSSVEADHLLATDARAIVRLTDGYLVLADAQAIATLRQSGLTTSLIATDVDPAKLALDNRKDRANIERYPLLYERDNLRLFNVDWKALVQSGQEPELQPIRTEHLRVEYRPSSSLEIDRFAPAITLDSLIGLVSQDTLQAYLETLQAFNGRYYGSPGNYQSRDWIETTLKSYGYDSVFQDSFYYNSTPCMNVIAVKPGSAYPELQIVIGAHRDAVSGSPGADDDGSGTAGVLEFARILRDVDTKCTFIFALFDSEEQGLNGSYHYVDEAQANGDSIIFMLNLDMIGHYQNNTQAKIYHGSDDAYADLWIDLGSQLVGITGYKQGNLAGSDHYPFSVVGIPVVFAHEYIFSTVYHSYQDSTTYINYDYMTRIIKASLATSYMVNETFIPQPMVTFNYPAGLPEYLSPGLSTTFEVEVIGSFGGTPVPSTGQLHYAVDGGGVITVDMNETSLNIYDAVLPSLTCGQSIEYYVSAEEVTNGRFYDPDPAYPNGPPVASAMTVAFADDFETDQGWSVSGGLWARGIPTGGGGQYGGPDPNSGVVGPNVFGYNLSGDYENNLPEHHLTSPAIDCSSLEGVSFSFWRWLGVEQPSYDHAYLKVSNNGTTWTTLWTNTSEVTDNSWALYEYDISSIADGQSTVYLRWTMGTTDGLWQFCGWNIDDVQVVGFVCEISSPLTITTDSMPDWTTEQGYSVQLEQSGGFPPYVWSDKNNDLAGTGLTMSPFGTVEGILSVTGPISFTALVTDDSSATAERLLSFTVNDAVIIVTSNCPNGEVDVPYSYQLVASGGTGPLVWIDEYGDLHSAGLALLSPGLVEGTPLSAGLVTFTVIVSDGIGSTDTKELSINFQLGYVCGDVDGSGGVDVSDITYLVDYLFRSGPPPSNMGAADSDGSGGVDVADLTWLVDYLFRGGPPPQCQ